MSPDGITAAGIIPAIILEMPKFENAALGLADVTSVFQLISTKEGTLGSAVCARRRSDQSEAPEEVPGPLLRHQLRILPFGRRNDDGCQHQRGSDAGVQLRHSTVQPGICDASLEGEGEHLLPSYRRTGTVPPLY